MNLALLAWRGLRHHWRAHLGAGLGTVLATMVLAGAWQMGEVVRGSLRHLALQRLGGVHLALVAGERQVRAAAASELAAKLGAPGAAVLHLRGTLSLPDAPGTPLLTGVRVYGVDEAFWPLVAPGAPNPFKPGSDQQVALAASTADRLGVAPGQSLLLRVERPSPLSRDALLSTTADATSALRLTVAATLADDAGGRFSLEASQVAPLVAFVPLSRLQAQLELPGMANLLLLGAPATAPPEASDDAWLASAQEAWREVAQLSDLGLELRQLAVSRTHELRSRQVFLSDLLAERVMAVSPRALGVYTYFVNELRVGERRTPYSMVAAMGPLAGSEPPPDAALPEALQEAGEDPAEAPTVMPEPDDDDPFADDGTDAEGLPHADINEWLAADLQAKPGDRLSMRFFVDHGGQDFLEREAHFTIRKILPMSGPSAERTLMPDFPGLSGAEHCREWRPGIPIDLDRIRATDEDYWQRFRGTPKAYIPLAVGRELWATRYGSLTALRWGQARFSAATVQAKLEEALDPVALGLAWQPVRAEALRAAGGSTDFGELFLGLSFFLMAAALLFTGLLFSFGVSRRAGEIGLLRAVGCTPARIWALLALEGLGLAALGALLGALAALAYTAGLTWALGGVWRAAVNASPLIFSIHWPALWGGALAGWLAAGGAMAFTCWRLTRLPPAQLLAGGASLGEGASAAPGRPWQAWIWLLLGTAAALSLLTHGPLRDQHEAVAFLGAGAALLVALLAALALALWHGARVAGTSAPSLRRLAWRNLARHPRRTLGAAGILACASFLVLAVGGNRHDANADASQRRAGTGGFALVAELTQPLHVDLNTERGREAFGLEEADLAGATVLHLRQRPGDDASCLNLNRPQMPPFLGVPVDEFASRGVFTPAATHGPPPAVFWDLLRWTDPEAPVPVIADANTLRYALNWPIGVIVTLPAANGRGLRLQVVAGLANSILQGQLLMDEAAFRHYFPDHSGYSLLLVDAPAAATTALTERLQFALRDNGPAIQPASTRLARFLAVENSYLSIFALLGGLGVILGSAGLGVLLLRQAHERRAELALLQAVGFGPAHLRTLILSESWCLTLAGLGCGLLAGALAIWPAWIRPGGGLPWLELLPTLSAMVLAGFLVAWLTLRWAWHAPPISALRLE